MPWTLYGYIFKDLLKQLLIVTVVVVVVLSLGISIEPLSDGVLGAGALLKVISYSLPGMLPYALPFAAVMAGTLVYARLSSDNEVTACLASGIGYRSYFLPAFVLGAVVAACVFVLSNWLAPFFWQKIEREIGEDLVQWVVRKIQGGKAVNLGREMLVYADRVKLESVTDPVGPPPHPHQRLILEGVAIGKLVSPEKEQVEKGRDYRSLQDSHTARRAVIDFYRDRDLGRNFATMLLHDVAIQDQESDRFVAADRLAFNAMEIPGALDENLQFLSKPRLKKLMRDPMRSEDIRRAHRELAQAVATQRLLDAVARDATQDRPLVFMSTGGLRYELAAPKVIRRPMGLQLRASSERPIETLIKRDGRLIQRLTARSGSLQPEDKLLESQPRLNLKLQDVTVTVTSLANTEARKNERIESMLGYPDAGEFNGKDLDIPKLLDASEPYGQQSVAGARHTLKVKVRRLRLQANGIIHARQAAASSCLLVMLLGAVMSTLLRRQVPLVVFFWCFLPTILAFLSINEGTKILQMYGVSQTTGYAVLWSGNGLLVLLILIGSRMLRRR